MAPYGGSCARLLVASLPCNLPVFPGDVKCFIVQPTLAKERPTIFNFETRRSFIVRSRRLRRKTSPSNSTSEFGVDSLNQ